MALKTERELVGTHRDSYNRAKSAVTAKNYDYAIALIQGILKTEPLFLDGRKMLRRAEIDKVRSKKVSMFGGGVNLGAMSKLNGIAKKTPAAQLEIAEEVLQDDPFNEAANQVIADAGVALGENEFRAFAQETVVEGKPTDGKALHKLAKVYMEIKQPAKAEKVYERILANYPTDGEALSGLKSASAAQSYAQNLEGKENDYRKSLLNEGQAIELENASKVVKNQEAIDKLIAAALIKFEAEPNNIGHPKNIAQLCENKGDLAAAVQWYQYAYEKGGSIDSALEQTIDDLKNRQFEQHIRDLRDRLQVRDLQDLLAVPPTEEERAILEQELQEWENARKQHNLETAQKMVRKYPQEGGFRFDLGKALYEAGQYRPGLQEFQQSLKQPSVRYQALNLMGLSYLALKMWDFAIKQFQQGANELIAMDDVKKEIVYNLGLAYEANGEPDKALIEFKKIYEVDITYKDVADRVEKSYEK